jgi:type I site-specific restriction endonuclease
MPTEAEIRRDNIDKQLAEAGWSRGQGNLVTEVFLSGTGKGIREGSQDYLPPSGTEGSRAFADYVLLGKDGEPLAVLEAKRDSRSPLEGEYQAVEYAERIHQQSGKLPFIFLGAAMGYGGEFGQPSVTPLRDPFSFVCSPDRPSSPGRRLHPTTSARTFLDHPTER